MLIARIPFHSVFEDPDPVLALSVPGQCFRHSKPRLGRRDIPEKGAAPLRQRNTSAIVEPPCWHIRQGPTSLQSVARSPEQKRRGTPGKGRTANPEQAKRAKAQSDQ